MKFHLPAALLLLALLCGRGLAQEEDSVQWPDQTKEEGDVMDAESPAPVDPAYLAAEEPEPEPAAPAEEPEPQEQPAPAPAEPVEEVRYRQEQQPLDASRCATVCKLDRATRTSKCETFCRKVESEEEAHIDIAKFAAGEPDAGSQAMVSA